MILKTRLANLIVATAFVLLSASTLSAQFSAQAGCTRHVEPEGGFSICIPDGWIVEQQQADQKFRALFGPRVEGFSPNINFKEEITSAALGDYVTAGIRLILASKERIGADSIVSLGRSDFRTEFGLMGVRADFQTLYKGFLVRTLQYYFDAGNDRKLIVTATSLEKNKAVFDPMFERSAKSFRLVR